MRKTKAFDLLTTLDKKELNSFSLYLKQRYSPTKLALRIFAYYHKKSDSLMTMPDVFDMRLAHKKICKKVMDDKSKKTFQNAIYQLETDLIDFLLQEKLKEDSFEKDQLLLQIFQERKKTDSFFSKIRQMEKAMQEAPVKKEWHSYEFLKIKHLAYFNNYTEKIDHQAPDIQELMTQLDVFYVNKKLRYSCELLSRKDVKEEDYDGNQLDGILKLLTTTVFEEDLRHQLYLLCYQLILNKSESGFKQLSNFLENHVEEMVESDRNIAFAYLNNVYVDFIKRGKHEYHKHIFDIFKLGINYNAFLHNEYFNPVIFQNIVTAASTQLEYKWSINFIQNYKEKLIELRQDDVVNISYAYLFFKQREFTKVIVLLREVTFRNLVYSLKSKGLILRSYYELKENRELIQDYMNAFQVFIKTQKDYNQESLDGYLTLIKYVKLLQKGIGNKSKIIQQINEEQILTFREWVLEKIDEL